MDRLGYEVIVLPVESDGPVDLELLERQLDEKPLLVSVMLANNEIGVIRPVADIARMCRMVSCLFHTDATQAVGKIPVDVGILNVDMLSASAHKLYGPKGMGMLFLADGKEREILHSASRAPMRDGPVGTS